MKQFFNKIFSTLKALIRLDSTVSSQRFSFLFTVILSNVAIIGTWVVLSFYNKRLIEIPESVLVLYGFANGLSMATKLVQNKQENKTEDKKE